MSDAETRSERELDAADAPPEPPVETSPPPAPRDKANNSTKSNGKLTLPPVQTHLSDPRLFEIINWAITLMSSEADFLRTPPWERDISWLEHTRFERAVVRELKLNGENMTIGGEKARVVTASGALSTNFPAAHRRNFGTLIIIVGAVMLVPAAAFEPVLSVVALSVMAVGALLIVRQGQLRTTLDVQSTGFSVNGGQARPLEDLVTVAVDPRSDRVVVKCRNPREQLIVAPRLVSDQRDFVRKTIEMEVNKIRTLNAFLQRRKSYETVDEDRPKLDLEAIQREVSGDDEEPLEDFVEFDGEVLVEEEVDGLPEVPEDDLEESTAVEGQVDEDADEDEEPDHEEAAADEDQEQDEEPEDAGDEDEEPADEDEEPVDEDEEPADEDEEPADEDEEPADEDEEPADEDEDEEPKTKNQNRDSVDDEWAAIDLDTEDASEAEDDGEEE